MRIVFDVPDREAPGYLRRVRTVLDFQEKITAGNVSAQMMDEMVKFLAGFVTDPADPEEARAALWDASEAQLIGLFGQLGGADVASDPLSGSDSTNGTAAKP